MFCEIRKQAAVSDRIIGGGTGSNVCTWDLVLRSQPQNRILNAQLSQHIRTQILFFFQCTEFNTSVAKRDAGLCS